MARETKVGMLLGLGFIVIFAIVLENRGRRSQTGPLPAHEILAQAPAETRSPSGTAAEERARDYGRSQSHRSTSPVAEPAPTPQREPATATRQSQQQPSEQRQGNNRPRGRGAGSRSSDNEPEPAGAHRSDPGRFSNRRELPITVEEHPATASLHQPDEQLADTVPLHRATTPEPQAANLAATPPADRPIVPDPVADPAPPPVRYRIRKGDTLGRIATEHYGTGSRRVIDAIYQANRSVLSNPDQLPLDKEIVLPEMEGAPAPATAAPEQPAKQPSNPPANQPPKEDYKYYQVEKGDRYATIARKLLGTDTRWKEIAELNKDIFPDPAKIRYGVRIRLPADARLPKGRDGA